MTSSVLVNLDGHGPSFEAVGIVGRWNGWAMPRVTVEVAREIAKHLEREGDFSTAAEVRAAIHGSACADGTVTLNLGLTFCEVEAPEDDEGEGVAVPRSLPQAVLGYATAVATSNLVRWAMTWAATEIAKENERARAAQTSKRDAERAALVSEIRRRRTEADPIFGAADPARAFQLVPRELFMVTESRVPSVKPVPWVELGQVPIGGTPRFDVPTEGAVVAYAGRVFVVVQLRRPAGWDPVWCLLSLSGDVCGFTEAEPDDEQGKAARVAEVSR